MEQYPNLPGFFIDLKDGGLEIAPTAAVSNRIILIGTATDGPYFTPVRVSRPQDGDAIFGTYYKNGIYNGKNLLLGLRQAYGAGCHDIVLMRIPDGTQGSLELDNGEEIEPAAQLIVKALAEGTVYNNVKVEVTATELKIWDSVDGLAKENDPDLDPTRVFTLSDFTNYGQLIDRVNKFKNTLDLYLELAEGISREDAIDLGVSPATAITAGTAGTDYDLGSYEEEETYRGQLEKAYGALIDYNAEIIVPLGVSMDVSGDAATDTDAVRLAKHCGEANSREARISGIISVSEISEPNATKVQQMVNKLTGDGSPSNLYPGPDDEDFGRFLSVVVGELIFVDLNIGVYSDLGAAAYAGLISSLPPHSATTNKVIANARGLVYNLYAAQLDTLTGCRYVALRNRPGRGVVVTDGITCAKPLSDFQRLSTLRISNSVINIVRAMSEPFIGEALNAAKHDALNTAIESGLRDLQSAGAISDFVFITYYRSLQDRVSGILSVDIDIVPAFEVRRIRVQLTLKPTL